MFNDRSAGSLLENQLRDQPGPAGLVTRAQSRPGLTMKILMEPVEVPVAFGVERIARGPGEGARTVGV